MGQWAHGFDSKRFKAFGAENIVNARLGNVNL